MSYLVKQNTAITVPVVMFGTDHSTELTGVPSNQVTVRAAYSDGTTAVITPTLWTEVDSTNLKGLYMITLPASAFNKPVGPVVLYVTSAAPLSDLTKREFYITANLVDEVYTQAQKAHRILEGKWIIDQTSNTLTLYDADGATVINVYDLFGPDLTSPSSSKIYKRVPRNAIS